MTRLLSLLTFFLAPLIAYAEAAEAPVEKASPMVVLVFLVLFIGSIVGYFVYIWWRRKADK